MLRAKKRRSGDVEGHHAHEDGESTEASTSMATTNRSVSSQVGGRDDSQDSSQLVENAKDTINESSQDTETHDHITDLPIEPLAERPTQRIAFHPSVNKSAHPRNDATLYIPGPRERDRGLVIPP